MQVLVVADGELDAAVVSAAVAPDTFVIAADGGARGALDAGVTPDLVIGDGDSLDDAERARLGALGVEIRFADPAKDESDTELCLLAAIDLGATDITLVGALGGPRPEHAVANLLLLADERFDGTPIALLDGRSRFVRIGSDAGPGGLVVEGRPGDHISLLALAGPVEGVRTVGLRFALRGERLVPGPARGLSNELVGERATIETQRGRLLVIQTPLDVEPVKEGEA